MTLAEAQAGFIPSHLYQSGTHLIGGHWTPARSGALLDVHNPGTSEWLAQVPAGSAEDVEAAVRAAESALPSWRDTSPGVRAELIRNWAAKVDEYAAEVDLIESMDVGRPSWGPSQLAGILTYVAGQVDKVNGVSLPTHAPATLAMTVREPYGVVGIILPWNAPAPMFVHEVAPAIGAGNTVVLKPAEDAPLAPLVLARLAEEAGIPAGVINVVSGIGTEAGSALAAHPRIDRMTFTGSQTTGRAVMKACAANLTPLQLELGGKSPQLVFSDADLDQAVAGIVAGITLNTGQICAAGSRVVVEQSVHDQLVGKLATAFAAITIGRYDEPVHMGPLASARQLERVRDYIKLGIAEGARLVVGGAHPPVGVDNEHGYFVAPTLFAQVDPSMRIAQEEIFGPVLAVIAVADEAEAIAVANGTEYGLAACVWTRDIGRALRIATAVQAGQVHVNTSFPFGIIGAPFGGYKSSGFGRTMGADAVLDYTQIKVISIDAS
ncbi:aldehyde dehydrogenase family protein [Kribbella sp. CA-293567]|uniref:aldehyde dehydrogenase family protein n=1 Tax=Kribbella sp. CA-293567 TaxID=3002436 RepID=UPI0022DD2658|nr:aldehyde dehydrogenase family protein [Kribbella sp. CA-293567]WBQ07923.1 aldehyde dehydrogenase family protein [Kribbella sp. CA-293567]